MARYVLIEFDDDAQADALCAQINTATEKGKRFRLVGFFAKPVKYCECGAIPESQMKHELTRGAKYGWLVHRACRRPRKMPQAPRNLIPYEGRFPAALRLDAEGKPIENHPIQEGY